MIYWHDRMNDDNGNLVSLMPLIQNQTGGVVTNILMSALDLNTSGLYLDSPDAHLIDSPYYAPLFEELANVQAHGIKVSGMMYGAFRTLNGNQSSFEKGYAPLRDGLKKFNFDGLDIDAEVAGIINTEQIIRLIDALRDDFGPDFLITFSPVASALSGGPNLSGFNYKTIEEKRGKDVAWYNAQFYNGFGFANSPDDYEAIVGYGFPPEKVVMGLSTEPANSPDGGYFSVEKIAPTLKTLIGKYPNFAGVAGWTYWDARPGMQKRPWEWSLRMAEAMGVK
jgi:chitinase